MALPAACLAVEIPFAAIISSAIMLPPVCPTLIPRLLIKLSIFWLIFKKATAHKNQTSTFPAAVSFPTDWTSDSVTAARTGMAWKIARDRERLKAALRFFLCFIDTSFKVKATTDWQ
jgi:hypothetical protein